MDFDPAHFAAISRIVWQRGGWDTLVKPLPFLNRPDRTRPVGHCTTYKHLARRTGPEIAAMFDLPERVFAAGLGLYAVAPLPAADEFAFLGYRAIAGGTPLDPPGYVSHPLYQPGLGIPLWDLAGVPQRRLVWIVNIVRGQALDHPVRLLPQPVG